MTFSGLTYHYYYENDQNICIHGIKEFNSITSRILLASLLNQLMCIYIQLDIDSIPIFHFIDISAKKLC